MSEVVKDEEGDLNITRGRFPAFSLFFYTFLSTVLVVYSLRALAEDDFWSVFVTDVVWAFFGFTIFKKMQAANTKREMFAYIVAIALGSQVAMHAYLIYMAWIGLGWYTMPEFTWPFD